MSEDRSDRRIRGETHIYRINNWVGSDSYVEGSRRDPEDFDPVPDQPKLPYRLLMNAYHDDVLRHAGDVVYIWPHQVGSHHAMIEGVEYPDEGKPPAPEDERRVPLMADQEDDPVKGLADAMARKDMRIADLDTQITTLQAELNAAKTPQNAQSVVSPADKPVEGAKKPEDPVVKPAEVAKKPDEPVAKPDVAPKAEEPAKK